MNQEDLMRFRETRRRAYERRQKTIRGKVVSEAWINKRRIIFPCIGYWTHPDHRNKGYASVLVAEILEGKHLVFAAAKPHNSSSIKILRKAGFRRLPFNQWVYIRL